MANINMASIMAKVKAYQKSSDGKKRCHDYIAKCRDDGKRVTDGGGRIITEEDMCRAALEMIATLKRTAEAHQLPPSVLAHFESLTYDQPRVVGTQGEAYEIEIYFTDDLSRMSLMLPNKPSDESQVKNIVSLFDTGYTVHKNRRRGVWAGHEELGVFAGLEHRDGEYFMSDAVESFNRVCGELYGVHATIVADEEFYSRI